MNILEKSRFAFVILHYLAYDMTIECVKTIYENINGSYYDIVIVDNGSCNGSGEKIKNLYHSNENIHVIILKENLGFAKGNNVGFVYAKEQLESKYICVLNNDVLIKQKDFIENCVKNYLEKPCAVLGPEIIRKDGSLQPLYGKLRNEKFYKKVRMQLRIELLLLKMGIDLQYLIAKYSELKKKSYVEQNSNDNKQYEDCVLHGCCWIFTPDFIEVLSGLDERTFLYREEEMLSILLNKNGLHNRYVPTLQVVHYEDVATNCVQKNVLDKRKFTIKNEIKSLNIVIKELEEIMYA